MPVSAGTVVSCPMVQGGKIGISAKSGVGGYMRGGLLYTFKQPPPHPTLKMTSIGTKTFSFHPLNTDSVS